MATVVYGPYIREAIKGTIDLDGDTIRFALVKATPPGSPDNTDHEFVDDVIAASVSTECDFTNYARTTLANVSVTYDAANNRAEVTFDAVTFSNAGNTTDNTIGAAVIYKRVGADDSTPGDDPVICYWDIGDTTTDGGTLVFQAGSEGAIQGSSA